MNKSVDVSKRNLQNSHQKTSQSNQLPNKKQIPKPLTSIDEKHTEMLNYFNDLETVTMTHIKEEISAKKIQLKSLADNEIERRMDLKDQIAAHKATIKTLQSKKKNYLLDNSKYIFDYFEHKQQISAGGETQNVNVLHSFFKVRSKNPERSDPDKYTQAKKIYQTYWKNVNNDLTNPQDFIIQCDVCESCHNGELIPQDEEGILICNNLKCGKFITYP